MADALIDVEAVMRVLDDHPEMIDEAYVVARNHPVMLQRFIAYATADMAKNDQLVQMVVEETMQPEHVSLWLRAESRKKGG